MSTTIKRPPAVAQQSAGTAVKPHVIPPTAIYWLSQARAALGLRESTIRRECREGRLRVGYRAGRRYVLGEWLLEWLRQGELPRHAAMDEDCERRRA